MARRWSSPPPATPASPSQHLIIRWLLDAELTGLHRELAELGLAAPLPPVQHRPTRTGGPVTRRTHVPVRRGDRER